MEDQPREVVDGIRRCFAGVTDPRVVARCDHLLIEILTIAILAVLCGADDWTDIELFANATRGDLPEPSSMMMLIDMCPDTPNKHLKAGEHLPKFAGHDARSRIGWLIRRA